MRKPDIIDKGYAVLAGLMLLVVIGMVLYRALMTISIETFALVFLVGATGFSFLALVGLTTWWFVWQARRQKQ